MASLFPAGLMEQIAGARLGVARLRTAMISVGVVLTAAALALIIFKSPGGLLLRLPGVYYGVLGAVAAYGAAEASLGYWFVVPRDMGARDWRVRVGETVLWISTLLLPLIAALGGIAFLK